MKAKPTKSTSKPPNKAKDPGYCPFFDKKVMAAAIEYAIKEQRKVMGLDKD